LTAVFLAIGGWCVAAACFAVLLGMFIRAGDAAQEQPPEPDGLMDALPCDCLSDGEIERRFARLVGWVR
jgi:hypothetical protein